MPGIFDLIFSRGALNSLMGQPTAQASALDTGDDTVRMRNRLNNINAGAGSVTSPALATADAVSTMSSGNQPALAPAMENTGSYDDPDTQLAIQQANQGAMPAAADPYANTSNARGAAFQQQLAQAETQQPGILQRLGIQTDRPLARLAMGLAAAGSQDPIATLMKLKEQEEEMRRARSESSKPKVVPLADGAFSLLIMPDGSQQIVKNSEVAAFLGEKQQAKFDQDIRKAEAQGRASASAAAAKEQIKTAGDSTQTSLSVNELNSIADSLDNTDTATGPAIGLLPKFARDIVTPAGADLQDRAERIIQASLRATLGAQFTEKEGARFLERSYNPRLDEKTNAARLRQISKELSDIQADKEGAIAYMKAKGTLDGFVPKGAGAPPAPDAAAPAAPAPAAPAAPAAAPAADVSAQAKSAFGSYEPNIYDYRVNNGVVQRRKK
jgi:hypothetical protein